MSMPTIVLLHGWGFDSRIWSRLQAVLTNKHVITIDLAGYGNQANNQTDWQLGPLVEDLITRTPKNAMWVGWSLGGLLALSVALHRPLHIKALMTLATTPCFTQRPGWDAAMDAQSFTNFKQSCQSDSISCIDNFKQLIVLHGDRETKRIIRTHDCNAETPTLLGGLKLLAEIDLRFSLASIQCPTTHLLAENDALVPAKISQSMSHLAPKANTLLIDNASHALPVSHPDVIAQQLDNLIHATH
ncbi:MAG: hypothetical protein COC05_04170 [Gammaproteobacteria bacterium]|nr:MAG: hypothetical protein COC05_04170 [Gammaproteobacteria bacterium]